MATFDEIKGLCWNEDSDSESDLLYRLKTTQINPGVLAERDHVGATLLHHAVMKRSSEFCRVIHDQNGTLVKIQDRFGNLPVHLAFLNDNTESMKYLLKLYPESSNIPDDQGWYPLHFLMNCRGSSKNLRELLLFLLEHDKGAVSTPTRDGRLPLHIACEEGKGLTFVKLIFDGHPDGIFVQDEDGDTPVDNARFYQKEDVVHFFETQIEFHCQAQEDQNPDGYGHLPIHRILQMKNENVSLGTIKLMVEANPASVYVADFHGCIPLHYACRLGDMNFVKYLVDIDKNSLTSLDSGGNLPLHIACLAGKLDIINFILKTTNHGVTVRNNDGKLPIQILLFDAICDRDLQYVDAVDSLFRANPVDSLAVICPGLFANTK